MLLKKIDFLLVILNAILLYLCISKLIDCHWIWLNIIEHVNIKWVKKLLYFFTGVELKKKKFKYSNLLDASVGLNSLSNFDENKIIISSKRKILLFDLNSKKISKKYIVQESGNIIGVFKKNK